ncbi:MAG TPA: NAD-dependent protein deacetylase [Polyangiaceae bacterium]|nr:NAD-dependent protein deacetylase [Polyangiaceae bacterium]
MTGGAQCSLPVCSWSTWSEGVDAASVAASAATIMAGPPASSSIAQLRRLLSAGSVFVLTGAGVSTDSGIPDYRDERGAWKGREPIQYRDFVSSDAVRRRYWARSMMGFPLLARAAPNAAHHALAELEVRRALSLLVTQNVDGLHHSAGSRGVVDLHGRIDQVRCLGCGALTSRATLQSELSVRNPDFLPVNVPVRVKPDGDAELSEVDYQRFELVDCGACGGILKPHVVFFGENVPAERVKHAMAALEQAKALLIVGTSLMVYSGFRFARAAARLGLPIAIVNRGVTRADELSVLKIHGNVGDVLREALR